MYQRITKKKKLLTVAMLLAFCAFINTAMGQTWQVGYPTATNVTATLNNGTLTISGTGAMQDWSTNPWYDVRNNIQKVIINSGVTKIGNRAFDGCSSINSVTIPSSVTSIGVQAFIDCSGLTGALTISNSVTYIGSSAFQRTGLTAINVDAANTTYSSQDGVLFNKNKTTLICCPAGKTGSHTIPNTVQTIESNAFSFCSKLIAVTIPNSVTSIGTYAFERSGLTSIIIPNSLTSINQYMFDYCSSLSSITIPNSIISIGNAAFQGCSALTSITIPISVTSIGDFAFSGTGLTKINSKNPTPPNIGGSYCFQNVNKTTCKLYVPSGSVNAYKTANGWKDFSNILIESTPCLLIDKNLGSTIDAAIVGTNGNMFFYKYQDTNLNIP